MNRNKQYLTIEQMQNLSAVGIHTWEHAEACHVKWTYDGKIEIEHSSPSTVKASLDNKFASVSNRSGIWSYEVTPAYDLQGLLSEASRAGYYSTVIPGGTLEVRSGEGKLVAGGDDWLETLYQVLLCGKKN